MTKRALVVDDSNTARQMLSSRLIKYGINVDALESAAAAIDYLYETVPDAIFMDYEMPGMDGFQALKVIKSNPKTAIIPVMMYTSKEGGLALSQARALGAVGVLPKQLEPQDLEDVLHSLHLMPEQESLVSGFRADEFEDPGRNHLPDNIRAIRGAEWSGAEQVETVSLPIDSFEDPTSYTGAMRRWVRRELNQTEERIQGSLDSHFDELRSELFGLEQKWGESSKPGHSQLLGVLSLIVGLCVMTYFLVVSPWEAGQQRQTQLNEELISQINSQGEKLDQLILPLNDRNSGDVQVGEVSDIPVSLLEWAANQGTGFGFGEIPFNDQRAIWLTELIEKLKEVGFQGTVELRATYGDFCLQKNAAGAFVLAQPGLAIDECQFSAQMEGDTDWRNDQSVTFANNLNYEIARSEGEIEIMLLIGGFSDPPTPYPPLYEVKTAGNWNRVASSNQRIKVNLYSSR